MTSLASNVVAAMTTLVICVTSAQADVFTVPSKVPTIQAAIDQARDGDTIVVEPGTYFVNLVFRGHAVTVRSLDGPEATILRPATSDWTVLFNAGETTSTVLSGFTLRDGDDLDYGSAIFATGSSPRIENNILEDNRSDEGAGAVLLIDSEARITGNRFVANETGGSGGAVYVLRGAPAIDANRFEGNVSDDEGGAIYGTETAIALFDNTFEANTAAIGGAVSLFECTSATLDGNQFTGNRAESGGTAISCHDVDGLRILGNIVADNTCISCDPRHHEKPSGALAIEECSDFLLRDNSIRENHDSGAGGGVRIDSSSGRILRNKITSNSTSDVGGGIYLNRNGRVHVIGNRIRGNSAELGGGVHVSTHRDTYFANNWITGNQAMRDGGGIYLGDTSRGTTTLTHDTIARNTAPLGAGIAFAATGHRVVNSIVYGNGPDGWNEIRSTVQGPTIDVQYTSVRDGFPGSGNLDADPRFVDPDAGDFHLTPDSECLGRGTDAAPFAPRLDIDGDPRNAGPNRTTGPGLSTRDLARRASVDLGADEIP